MRTMRDFPWRYVFIAIPIIGVAAGLQYLVRNVIPESSMPEKAMTLRPSSFKATSAGSVESVSRDTRVPASREIDRTPRKTIAEREEDASLAEMAEDARPEERPLAKQMPAAAPVSQPRADAAPSATDERRVTPPSDPYAERYGISHAETRAPAQITGEVCSAVEYRGDGAEGTKITSDEWATVTRQFQGVKGELMAWLGSNRKNFADKSVEVMEKQLRAMTIQRPPQTDEPDLNWRGIAVYGHDRSGAPQVRLGSGFVKLAVKQPNRARFELARLVAQAWSPCELQKRDGGTPWEPLLKCMGLDASAGCGFGSYSENGWAVSSVLAHNVAPPGCVVQAFKEGNIGGCVKKIPFPLGTHAAEVSPVSTQSADTVARR